MALATITDLVRVWYVMRSESPAYEYVTGRIACRAQVKRFVKGMMSKAIVGVHL